jgi:hypothetical protein
MKLKVITFVLLSGFFILIVFGWDKNHGLSELTTPEMYRILALFIGIILLIGETKFERGGLSKRIY